jgi:tetratricopeptide (TPR) repeat protein
MGARLLIGSILLCLSMASGCNPIVKDGTQIPPPYSDDFEMRKDNDRLEFLTDCIRRRIDLAGSYYKRAEIYLSQGAYESALSDIDHAISAKDNVGEYYLLRGIIHRELNRLEPALRDAERAEALQQKSPKLYILMADILQEDKKYKESAQYISGVLGLAPYDASVYYVQGMLQTKTGDTLQGLASIEKALDLNPAYFRAYPHAATLHLQRGDYQNAHRVLSEGLKHFPASIELLTGMGRMYSERSFADSALLYYVKAVQIDKNNLDLLAEMGAVYTKAKNYSSALKIYEDIQRKKPDYPSINFLIGFSQEKLWRWNLAKSYYEKELELTPGNVPARNGLWRISQLENERARANSNPEGENEPPRTLDNSRINIVPIQPRSIQN